MRKIILPLLVFLFILDIVYAIDLPYTFDLKNCTGIDRNITSYMMLGNSSALFHIGNCRIQMNYEPNCFYNEQSAVPNCWSQDTSGGGTITIVDDPHLGKKSIKLRSTSTADYDGYKKVLAGASTIESQVQLFITEDYSSHTGYDSYYELGTSTDCGSTANLITITTGNNNVWNLAGEGGTCYDFNYGITREAKSPIMLYMNTSGRQFLSNFADGASKSVDPTLSGATQFEILTGGPAGGHDIYSSYIWLFNNTPSINRSANVFYWKINVTTAQTGLNIGWLGSETTRTNTTLSCNNGTNWVFSNSTNSSDLSCPNGQGSNDFIIGIYLANETQTINGFIVNGLAGSYPPAITQYNMTSEGGSGCTVWDTDKSNPCNTSDSTPTVFVRTDIFARCAIGVTHSNYSDLGDARECAGGGTTEHTCTLISQDELTSELSNVYIGCKNNAGIQNLTSTSGALALNVTGIEDNSRRAIELGVRNSLIDSYAIYTDQKVYARNSANIQAVGRFDKVAKKLNKIWAFNRVGTYEGLVNMFNITPVLYVLEITNKTNTTITNQVELLINATK